VRLRETPVPGAWVVELDRLGDERGWFARTFDAALLAEHGIDFEVVQANASFNARPGTLRGLHLQAEPHGEPKIVRCVRGAIWDVAVDLRPGSPAYCRWHAVELTADNRLAYLLPSGVAHGFQTLTEDCEVHYLMGHHYVPEAATGVRWDDPAFGIDWPPAPGGRTIAEKDRAYPDFAP
jgi:dTDP-4-dehydrorhamnose 3,5-epimerase